MESRSLRHSAIPPSDFLYYDPYYLLLKERSKSYPKVVEKFYNTKSVESKPIAIESELSRADKTKVMPSGGVVSELVDDLSHLMQSDLMTDKLHRETNVGGLNAPDTAVIQALISTSITESSALDPVLGHRIRKLGEYVTQQGRIIENLTSRIRALENEAKQISEENKTRIESNTRVMNALYGDIDKYKARIESSEERLKQTPPNLRAEFDDLQNRYFVAMKIIDQMNWPSPDDEEGTVVEDN